jgi:hypothetical protein
VFYGGLDSKGNWTRTYEGRESGEVVLMRNERLDKYNNENRRFPYPGQIHGALLREALGQNIFEEDPQRDGSIKWKLKKISINEQRYLPFIAEGFAYRKAAHDKPGPVGNSNVLNNGTSLFHKAGK